MIAEEKGNTISPTSNSEIFKVKSNTIPKWEEGNSHWGKVGEGSKNQNQPGQNR